MTTWRLNKFIAHATGTSRREADLLIQQGRVRIDDTTAILGTPVDPDVQNIYIDTTQIKAQHTYTYLAINKPPGYVCSRKKQGGTPTIYTLLESQFYDLKPVGRLDKDSSGLLLLTDDGNFAHQMTHPSFHKTKSYDVSLATPLTPLHRQMISDHGVELEDGNSKLQLTRIHDDDDTQWTVTMHEGRNRQIRRTFLALGYTVIGLHRTAFGPYSLDDLAPGSTRAVDPK